MKAPRLLLGGALLTALVAAGCGYALRASLPANVRTVHVPVLINRTQEPGIEDFITQALTQAIVTSGLARVEAPGQADGILEGTIVEYTLTSLAFDRTANVTQYRLRIALSLTLKRRDTNEVLWRQNRIEDQADFRVAGAVTQTLVREEQALQQAAVNISRAIVSLAFEGF